MPARRCCCAKVSFRRESLYEAIMSLVSDEKRLSEMSEKMGGFAKCDALEKIAELLEKMEGN